MWQSQLDHIIGRRE